MARLAHFIFQTAGLMGLVVGMSGLAKGNLVYNGNFGTGDFTDWTLTGDVSGTSVTGAPGAYFAALTTVSTNGFLSQSLVTTTGQQYTVSFLLAGDGATPNSFSASLGGTNLVSLTNIPDTLPSGTTYSYNFTATSSTSLLSFDFVDNPGYLYLTDVSVVANTPEPSTASLSLGALFLIGCVFWKRRKEADRAA